ncbi:MAG: deoxyguanosinetriphosphate triphosphohydrolase, partial [Oscillospiraceae bacterium]|nr:deoxyguanosinetriphosphate triphosphohydrolase [Oscillospiraceae bacterium]
LPAEYQSIAMRDGLDRAVCDYISGMSDRYAIKLYNDFFVPKGWSRE